MPRDDSAIWSEGELDELRRSLGGDYEGRTCLVTGADGFMGSHLTDALVELGAEVIAFVRATSSGALNNIGAQRSRLARVVFADLTDKTSIDYLIRELKRADVRLRAEVEDERPVGRARELVANEVVDRGLVGEVGEDDAEPPPQVADVVERPRRGRADEGDHVGAELDQRVGQVRAHEPVGAGDEHRAAAVDVAEVAP